MVTFFINMQFASNTKLILSKIYYQLKYENKPPLIQLAILSISITKLILLIINVIINKLF